MTDFKKIIKKTKGKLFSVTFVKKNGDLRLLNGRMGVNAGNKVAPTTAHISKYIVVYDIKAKSFRNVNTETITCVKAGGKVYTAKN